MSSFCQNVDFGADVSGGPKSTSGSPSSFSRSALTSSSNCGFAGFASEYDFNPNRPVTSITSSLCRPSPYSRKLIAVAFLASEIVLSSSTFFDAPAAGATNTSDAASTPSTNPLPLTDASHPVSDAKASLLSSLSHVLDGPRELQPVQRIMLS